MSYADKLVIDTHTHMHGHTDAGNDNTQRLKLTSGKKFLSSFKEQDKQSFASIGMGQRRSLYLLCWLSFIWTKSDLAGQYQSRPKTIGILTNVFSTRGPNVMVLFWMSDTLFCGQACDWHTHTHRQTPTHTGNDKTERQNQALGKNYET